MFKFFKRKKSNKIDWNNLLLIYSDKLYSDYIKYYLETETDIEKINFINYLILSGKSKRDITFAIQGITNTYILNLWI